MIPSELSDAACIVVRLGPSEPQDIKALRDTLRHFAVFDTAAPAPVRAHAQHAATCLNLILLGAGGAPADLLAQAREGIDAAIRASTLTSRNEPRITTQDLTAITHDPRDAVRRHDAMVSAAPMVRYPTRDVPVIREHPIRQDGGSVPDAADLALLADFSAESRESIAGAEAALLELEANPENIEAINTVFRAFHTVKGTAAFLGLDHLAEFAHHAESLLSRVRAREVPFTQAVANLTLRSNDVLGRFLDAVERSVQTDAPIALPSDYAALMHDLLNVDALLAGLDSRPAAATWNPVVVPGPVPVTPTLGAGMLSAARPPAITRSSPLVTESARGAAASRMATKASAGLSVRVRTDRLDRLIDMVGELTIAHAMIAADPAVTAAGHHDLVRKVSHVGTITRELQDLSMSMRMVPLKALFQKLTRLVRDVALKAGKVVELITEGEETELDRNMVDVLTGPLVHMLRNAVDHGVESPTDREKAGKSRKGRVQLAAYQQGDSVLIELRDDGRGLNRDRILAKAIERGLVAPNTVLTDHEVNTLIFAPGFSTAEQITDLSGRGVGMDVVRRDIESIRGRIDIQSALGKGTAFQIRLPLTLAVTDGVLVRVGEER
jgi:two-component system chemotaxis sensor kinase CheA